MVGESLAIICIILIMAFMYRRAGKRELGLTALPLICVPLARLINIAVLSVPSDSADKPISTIVFIVGGLIANVVLCMLAGKLIANKSARMMYLVCSFIFSGALTIAYIIY